MIVDDPGAALRQAQSRRRDRRRRPARPARRGSVRRAVPAAEPRSARRAALRPDPRGGRSGRRLGAAGRVGLARARSDRARRPARAAASTCWCPDAAEIADVRIETEYAVFPGEPWVRITTTIRNDGDAPGADLRLWRRADARRAQHALLGRRTRSRPSARTASRTRASIARTSSDRARRWRASRT